MPDVVLYAGPSAFGLDPLAEGGAEQVDWRPPVRRGDVECLLTEERKPGVLVVCDGLFQVTPAVSHAELCRALDQGWQVWGVSSIGAIRAYELRGEGMRGFGEVYAMFERYDDYTDDELCMLHFPEPPYFPVSEALVNLRHAFDCQGERLGISSLASAAVIAALREMWFGDRTEERIRALLASIAGCHGRRAQVLLTWLRQHRVKTTDLKRLLRSRPWRVGTFPEERP